MYILAAILIFGILIALHELGHFLAAKGCGVRVNEFSIGMGPAIFHKTKGETEYSIRILPIGGYCAMEGEDEESDDPSSLERQGFWKKLLIFAAGAGMNLLTGFVIVLLLYAGAQGFIVDAVSGLAAETQMQYDLQAGDEIYRVNGYRTYLSGDASLFLTYAGDTAEIEVVRNGAHLTQTIVRQDCTDTDGKLYRGFGIFIGGTLIPADKLGVRLRYSWYQTLDFVQTVWYSLQMLVTGSAGMDDLSGPVGIVSTIKDVGEEAQAEAEKNNKNGAAAAAESILYFASLIAVNLAVMNLLPIPALEGGKIFFLLVNTAAYALFRRKIPPKYENYIHAAGFALLMALMLFITFRDVMKLL